MANPILGAGAILLAILIVATERLKWPRWLHYAQKDKVFLASQKFAQITFIGEFLMISGPQSPSFGAF